MGPMGDEMMRGCNRCNCLHNELRGCPECGCPEYRLIIMECVCPLCNENKNVLREAVVHFLVRDSRYGEAEEDYVNLSDEAIADLMRKTETHLFKG